MEKFPCNNCGALILAQTSEKYSGLCAQCGRKEAERTLIKLSGKVRAISASILLLIYFNWLHLPIILGLILKQNWMRIIAMVYSLLGIAFAVLMGSGIILSKYTDAISLKSSESYLFGMSVSPWVTIVLQLVIYTLIFFLLFSKSSTQWFQRGNANK